MSSMQPGWVYLLQTGWHYKIGKSKDVRKRVAALQTASPYLIELVYAVRAEDMDFLESFLHQDYDDNRVSGEWFELSSEQVKNVKDKMLKYAYISDTAVEGVDDVVQFMEGDYQVKQIEREVDEELLFPDEDTRDGYFSWLGDGICPRHGYDCDCPRMQASSSEQVLIDKYLRWQEELEAQWAAEDEGIDMVIAPGDYPAGAKVIHPVFGEGIVVTSKPTKDDLEVTIAFAGKGVKRLLQSFANLQLA